MKKLIGIITFVLFLTAGIICGASYIYHRDPLYILKPRLKVERILLQSDKDHDGIDDLDDIVQGARMEVKNKTKYKSAYYQGGYPPATEGVCTDVIWRALKNAGYDLKTLMDKDIAACMTDYPVVAQKPDTNIDFRRVKNQYEFFMKYGKHLTLEVKPNDAENLKEWQGGDIVVVGNQEHIAIISDKRRSDGVPYVIHNPYAYPREEDRLLTWSMKGKVTGHFRYPNK